MVKLIGQRFYQLPAGDPGTPLPRDLFVPIIRSSDLAVDRPCGVGVVAQVDGQQGPLTERLASIEGPEGGFQPLDHVTGTA